MSVRPYPSAGRAARIADRFGMVWSALCALHCALLPLMFVLMPSLLLALHSHRNPHHRWALLLHAIGRWEWLIALLAGVVALLATLHGWHRHARITPVLYAASGAGLLMLATLFAPVAQHLVAHASVSVAGGALLVLAHYRNLRLGLRGVR